MKIKPLNAYDRWGYIPKVVRHFVLTENEQIEFDAGIERLLFERNKVAKFAEYASGELLGFNCSAVTPLIFWCFNNWSEPLLLNRQLPEHQPLCAAVSSHALTEKWRLKRRFHEHLVSRYLQILEEREVLHPKMIIGGNCQGAPVAESLAIRIKATKGFEPLLITLDYVPRKLYDGPMFMMFGRFSAFNPFNSDIDPIPLWHQRDGDWGIGILNETHGKYFREPTLFELRDYITFASNRYLAQQTFDQRFY